MENSPPPNKQQLKEPAVRKNSLVMSMVCSLDAIIARQGYATKH